MMSVSVAVLLTLVLLQVVTATESAEPEQSDEHRPEVRRNTYNPFWNPNIQSGMYNGFQPSYVESSISYRGQRQGGSPLLASSFGATANQQGTGPVMPYSIDEIPRRVLSAVGNKVQQVSAVVQAIPHIFTTLSSGVFIQQGGYAGSNSNANGYGQSNFQSSANGAVFSSPPGSSNANANHRTSTNFSSPSFQASSSNYNPFPVVVINPSQNQQSSSSFGQNPSQVSPQSNTNKGSASIPIAPGGVKPPSDYVPHDQPFVLNIDPFSSLNTQQSQNSNNFPFQGSSSIGGSSNIPSHGNNFGGSTINTQSQNPNNFPPSPQPQGSNNFGGSPNKLPAQSTNNFGGSANTPSTPNVFTVVNGIQEFTLDLLSTFRVMSKKGNVVFSPVSISSLLSLLALATNGLSQHEIEVALHIPGSQTSNTQHVQFESILRRLNHFSQGINITTSSRLFLEQSIPIFGSFTKQAAAYYNSSVSLENFRRRPIKTKNRVNRWVEHETQGKITEFISEPFSPDTLFVAANTIFFSGDWQTPFPEYFTGLRDFDTGRTILRVPMMTNVFTTPHYYSSYINVDIVSLPYKGGEFAMFVILPRESPQEKSIRALESQLDTFLIEELIANMTSKSVSVSLPKMRMAMKTNLVNSLSQLNIQSIFSPITADFSDLTSKRPLWVGALLHEAVMEVTEVGTVAAAVSAATLDRIGGYQRININKPAIIFIRDLVTGLPLFWTRLVKPETVS